MERQFAQLEAEGYTVFPNFLDTTTTARIRAHMDSLLPPVAPLEDTSAPRLHTLRHPIPGAIMAEILNNPRLLELGAALVKARELRMLEQVLIRTDPQPGPHVVGGWHIDMPFLPRHYNATPRQTYYHLVHALNTVAPGGGAFTIVPGSHHKTYAAAEKLGSEERLPELHKNPIEVAGIDVNEAIEICPNEGDLLVFNPMALHSGSPNITPQPRYVYFASFCDVSALYLRQHITDTNYLKGYPDSLIDNLPAELRPLLNVTLPANQN